MDQSRQLTSADDPRIPPRWSVAARANGRVSYRDWQLPLEIDSITLREGLDFLSIVGAPQQQIPEIVRQAEGKHSPLVQQFLFGGVELDAHDCIHLLLGRGLLPKDEAFVVGFTMGSTNRLGSLNQELFAHVAGRYYPRPYRLDAEALRVFFDGVRLGHLCDCPPLDRVEFARHLDQPLGELRQDPHVPARFLDAYYQDIEGNRYPDDPASARLVSSSAASPTWTFADEQANGRLAELAARAERRLNRSDRQAPCPIASLDRLREACLADRREELTREHDLGARCLHEIQALCGDEHAAVQKDRREQPWDRLYEQCLENVARAAEEVVCLDQRGQWEQAGPGLEARSFVHALLHRGDAAVDRAFCRGFFDGSSDDRSSYAVLLKLDVLGHVGCSLDGPYDAAMGQAYDDGVQLSFVSDVRPLREIAWNDVAPEPIARVREALNLSTSILCRYQELIEGPRIGSNA